MEKSNENLLVGAQNELRKEMAMLQKKIMMDTVSFSTDLWKLILHNFKVKHLNTVEKVNIHHL